jgi:hypothetical protein
MCFFNGGKGKALFLLITFGHVFGAWFLPGLMLIPFSES